MKLGKFLAGACFASAMVVSTAAQAADIVIGVPNWPSVKVTAHVLKVVLEDNLGLDVELQTGNNAVVFEAMDSGSMHVHPEVWMPNQVNLHNTFVKDKGTVRMNPNGVAGDQAMCVTQGHRRAHRHRQSAGSDRSGHGEKLRHGRRRQG